MQYLPSFNNIKSIRWEVLSEGYAIITANTNNVGEKTGANRMDIGSTEGHILTIDEMPKHSHEYIKPWVFGGYPSNNGSNHDNGTAKTSEVGGNKAHTHNLNIKIQKLLFWRRIS